MSKQFCLNDKQLEQIKAWASKHEKVYTGAIGGRYTYTFTPTSVGMIVNVIDCVTKEKLDISNYEDW